MHDFQANGFTDFQPVSRVRQAACFGISQEDSDLVTVLEPAEQNGTVW